MFRAMCGHIMRTIGNPKLWEFKSPLNFFHFCWLLTFEFLNFLFCFSTFLFCPFLLFCFFHKSEALIHRARCSQLNIYTMSLLLHCLCAFAVDTYLTCLAGDGGGHYTDVKWSDSIASPSARSEMASAW